MHVASSTVAIRLQLMCQLSHEWPIGGNPLKVGTDSHGRVSSFPRESSQNTQQTRATDLIVSQCWATVYDACPTLDQHWVGVSCLLGRSVWLVCGWEGWSLILVICHCTSPPHHQFVCLFGLASPAKHISCLGLSTNIDCSTSPRDRELFS